eukprot:TRINITY_DN8084_c0_g1_i1.p3 TRINITY_DN8084_c0_g1~~TRINITY_DN8084_c0_g1_i1.p3  ORF type:complete len:117 (-),score=12.49 TRINITY_DN8084_c0_g1_i1:95-445(-)
MVIALLGTTNTEVERPALTAADAKCRIFWVYIFLLELRSHCDVLVRSSSLFVQPATVVGAVRLRPRLRGRFVIGGQKARLCNGVDGVGFKLAAALVGAVYEQQTVLHLAVGRQPLA